MPEPEYDPMDKFVETDAENDIVVVDVPEVPVIPVHVTQDDETSDVTTTSENP